MIKNFYKKFLLAFFLVITVSKVTFSQNQGLYIDTVKWVNTNTVVVNVKSQGFTNVVGMQGSISWETKSLQYVSTTVNSTMGAANFTLSPTSNATNGFLAYIFTVPGSGGVNHTFPDGTNILSITFNVVNNPLNTYSNNKVNFSNAPTSINIDTAADNVGLSDLGSLTSPNLERHTSGEVSFARPPVLTYANSNVTDSITNRPAGCTYQWTVDGNPVTGTSISSFDNSPAGNICLSITYPNGNSVNCASSVLPVKWLNFDGRILENKIVLNWATAKEINNRGFAIEKSNNGIQFSQIGFVIANSNNNYQFVDAFDGNKSYYRLKQVDINGNFSYSKTILINSKTSTQFSMYPNPSKTFVNISANNIEQVIIRDMLGKTIFKNNFAEATNIQINTSSIANGIYNVSIITKNGVQSQKLVINK